MGVSVSCFLSCAQVGPGQGSVVHGLPERRLQQEGATLLSRSLKELDTFSAELIVTESSLFRACSHTSGLRRHLQLAIERKVCGSEGCRLTSAEAVLMCIYSSSAWHPTHVFFVLILMLYQHDGNMHSSPVSVSLSRTRCVNAFLCIIVYSGIDGEF